MLTCVGTVVGMDTALKDVLDRLRAGREVVRSRVVKLAALRKAADSDYVFGDDEDGES